MRGKSPVASWVRATCLGFALLGPSSAVAPAQVVTEFSEGITPAAGLLGITSGPGSNLWFTEWSGNRIGRITLEGVVTEFSAGITANAQPFDITAGPDGNVWFTERTGNRIGRITPAGVITEFSAGITANSGPYGITAGPDGNLWFTENFGNRIGRISTAGVVTEFSTGITPFADLRGITAGPDGNLWFAEVGVNRIGRITPLGVVTEFSAGITSGPIDITAGPDGNLWFAGVFDKIGRITPLGVVTEFSDGITAGSAIVAITAGPDGHLWFAESNGDRIGRISTAGVVTEFSDGITPNALPADITAGPDGNLWFTEQGNNAIGRITTGGSGTAPTVTSVAPASGDAAAGTAMTITGTGFVVGATATVGGVAASDVDVTSPTTADATAPALMAGTLNAVSLVNPDTASGTLAAAWFADFTDVPQADIFHDSVEKLIRNGVTAGCGGGNYCRNNPVTRAQMAVFLLKAKLGSGYTPPACTGLVFNDVPCTGDAFDPWIEDLAARQITGGCGGGAYCPGNPVTRAQMAVFLLKTLLGSDYDPPACTGLVFTDVPCTGGSFDPWIEDLAARQITGGCGGGNYCPGSAVTRGQMAVFLVKTFGLP